MAFDKSLYLNLVGGIGCIYSGMVLQTFLEQTIFLIIGILNVLWFLAGVKEKELNDALHKENEVGE